MELCPRSRILQKHTSFQVRCAFWHPRDLCYTLKPSVPSLMACDILNPKTSKTFTKWLCDTTYFAWLTLVDPSHGKHDQKALGYPCWPSSWKMHVFTVLDAKIIKYATNVDCKQAQSSSWKWKTRLLTEQHKSRRRCCPCRVQIWSRGRSHNLRTSAAQV